MVKKLGKIFYLVICTALIFQLAGCGTLLYPERRGQRAGRIDVGIAVLDGIGLLFFLIPGVIAYAVDFSNGTIYLPATSRGKLDLSTIQQVRFDPKHYNNAAVEKIIQEKTGYAVKLDRDNVQISRLKSMEEMIARFAQALPEIQNQRLALKIR
jgi:hypothetical protein